jgi:protease-4
MNERQDNDSTTPDSTPDTEGRASASRPDTNFDRAYALIDTIAAYCIRRDRDERRWVIVRRAFITLAVLMGVGTWVMLYAPMLGFQRGPTEPGIGVIPVTGVIGAPRGASADLLVPTIERACRAGRTRAVVLRIASPGGSPTDAERIGEALALCRQEGRPRKEVVAIIEGVGASAAYMIAANADHIVANRYAQVGSIGAVMRTYDAEGALEKLGVRERSYASGRFKTTNGMWSSNSPEQDELAQSMVDDVANLFIAEVQAARAGKLASDPDLFSGRTWLAAEALELGLIDEIGVFDTVLRSRYEDLSVHEYRPRQTFHDRMGMDALVDRLGASIVARLGGQHWE